MIARLALSLAMVAVLTSTAQAQIHASKLMGQVSYPDRAPLGKLAVLEVTLEDVSDPAVAGVAIATTRMPKPGQAPVIFSIDYDASRVKPGGRYALRARIVDAGAMIFETASPVRVLTQGVGSVAIVTLVPVQPTPVVASAAVAPKPAPAPKATPAPKPALKPAPEPTIAAAPKPTPTPAPKATPEPKATAAPKPAPEPKASPAAKPAPEPKAVPEKPKPAPAPETKTEVAPKSTPAPKPAVDVKPAPTPAPEPKKEPAPRPEPAPKAAAPLATLSINLAGNESLAGIVWTMVEIDGKPVGPADKDQRRVVLAFNAHRGTFTGASGCTDPAGSFAKNGAPLGSSSDKSSPVCRVDEQTERAMQKVIKNMHGYRVSLTTVELLDAKGALLAKLAK